MARVNIITSVSDPKSPAKIKRVGMWLVEEIKGEIPVTHHGYLARDSATAQELTLQLLANGLTKASKLGLELEDITLFFNCQIVENAFYNKWLEKWEQSAWKSAKGKDIADKDLWILVQSLLTRTADRHIVMKDKSKYENWMQNQIYHEQERLRQQQIAEESIKKIHEKLA